MFKGSNLRKGLLFVGPAISKAPHLWMRRMLSQLKGEVVWIATDKRPDAKIAREYPISLKPETPQFTQRVLSRLGLRETCPWEKLDHDWMLRLVDEARTGQVIVHFLTWGVMFSSVWKVVRKPVFVFCHGYDVCWDLKNTKGKDFHPSDYVNNILDLPSNVMFVANSYETKKNLEKIGLHSDRIFVKYLGVPVPKFVRKHTEKQEYHLLYLGRLVDCKGPIQVIDAFDIACEKGLRGRLLIAGDGPLRQACEARRANSRFSSKIEMLGAVDEATGIRLREKADIFTAHNRKGPTTGQEEAFGVSIVEAMAAGLPVVSGRSGAVPEVVRDGVDGILVGPGDLAAHADAFLRLTNSAGLRNEMANNAWTRANELFNEKREFLELQRILSMAGDEARGPKPDRFFGI